MTSSATCPRSHVLTLQWVIVRRVTASRSTARCSSPTTIVKDAARKVLEAEGPVRVYDGEEFLGLVDDEDILRVVVAEEESEQ